MITQTIEQLYKLGFHCDNFLVMSLPAEIFDLESKQMIGLGSTSNRYEPVVVKSYEITPETIELINNSKLIGWYPRSEPINIRVAILDNLIS
jgi:hypothetical protein